MDGESATTPQLTATNSPARSRRWRRLLKRLGIALLALFVVLTASSLIYNAVTNARAAPPAGLTYVQTGAIQTRYRVWGSPSLPGPAIVLIHGAFESADTWEPLATLLARAHHVEAYDVKGYGYTQRKGPYTVEALAQQLNDFLTARGLVRPILVAHSSGAGVVARFVLDHPTAASGIVFVDGDALSTGVRTSWLPRALLDPWRTTVLRLLVHSDSVIRTLYSAACGSGCPKLGAAGLDQWRRPFEVAGAEQAIWDMLAAGIPGIPADQVARIAALRLPAAVVFGAQDNVFSAASPAQTAERIGAPAPTIIPGAGHLSFISHPDAVAAVVEQLYGRVTGPAGAEVTP
ncbi:MAG TPA: alpha/beta hydrolase [Ktedonobacterales bacterium]|nr:alpha/beta hydrolase [Ktedonobacterales bacterium]